MAQRDHRRGIERDRNLDGILRTVVIESDDLVGPASGIAQKDTKAACFLADDRLIVPSVRGIAGDRLDVDRDDHRLCAHTEKRARCRERRAGVVHRLQYPRPVEIQTVVRHQRGGGLVDRPVARPVERVSGVLYIVPDVDLVAIGSSGVVIGRAPLIVHPHIGRSRGVTVKRQIGSRKGHYLSESQPAVKSSTIQETHRLFTASGGRPDVPRLLSSHQTLFSCSENIHQKIARARSTTHALHPYPWFHPDKLLHHHRLRLATKRTRRTQNRRCDFHQSSSKSTPIDIG